MRSIKRLPQAVRSSVRSGVILFDFTRVVEELVFNSLDARATRVSIFISAGTCYVKVVDNGSGITRDGLVLLGERYATSKLHYLDGIDADGNFFGFRGEALASISDISVLEIVTKAYGRPNAYRKVTKGCKCLYLGIDNDRKDVGTTVIVRDLFYNQPVRRKSMVSSPRKVLHDVRKCVFQTALVHWNIAFKVVDIESEEELLCTSPSSSPLSLLMSGFGIEDSSFLYKVETSNDELKLSGYLSGPCYSFTTKVFQYVYINSRFVCKGPIHKLLNQLANNFEYRDPWKPNNESRKGKRNRIQAYPSYILNLSCPRSLYNLAFEPSKTFVEFKDWDAILTFVAHTILHFWKTNIIQAGLLEKNENWQQCDEIMREEESLENSGCAKKKCKIQNYQEPLHLLPSPLEMQCNEQNNLDDWDLDRHAGWSNLLGSPDRDASFTQKKFLAKTFIGGENFDGHTGGNNGGSHWKDESPEVGVHVADDDALGFYSHETRTDFQVIENINKPFLHSCSLQSSPINSSSFPSNKGFCFPAGRTKTKRRWTCSDKIVDNSQSGLDNLKFSLRTLWNNEASNTGSFSGFMKDCDLSSEFEPLSGAYAKSFASYGKISFEGQEFSSGSASQHRFPGLGHKSMHLFPLTSSGLLRSSNGDMECFNSKNSCEWKLGCGKEFDLRELAAKEEQGPKLSNCVLLNSSSLPECTSIHTEPNVDFENCADSFSDLRRLKQYDWDEMFFLDHYYTFNKKGQLYLDSCGHDFHFDKYKAQVKETFRRSHSAPPFYRQKRKFVVLNCNSTMKTEELDAVTSHDLSSSAECCDVKQAHQSPGICHLPVKPSVKDTPLQNTRLDLNTADIKEIQQGDRSPIGNISDFMSGQTKETLSSQVKWQSNCTQTAVEYIGSGAQSGILDIFSGFLHLAGDSLVPGSISKTCLQNAKVLQQVDKKFIPVVASGTLVVIDQHAADERIRLEELRQKVLSGEARTVTYLDDAHELILPEVGYQLLENYADQIRDWGWICKIHDQGSRTFKKNLNLLQRNPVTVTLLAVPCILGVSLSDVDLLEFLQQLADTDGSSTVPPSVIKILNSKACRGAIMFGDSLLPAECSLIVEELKQTSLCFQCAHGRPTTAPVVNLDALHKQVAKLDLVNDRSDDFWHGLRRHAVSLQRAAKRLSRAKDS